MDLLWLAFGGLGAFVAMALMSHERQRRLDERALAQQQPPVEDEGAVEGTPAEATPAEPTPSRKAA